MKITNAWKQDTVFERSTAMEISTIENRLIKDENGLALVAMRLPKDWNVTTAKLNSYMGYGETIPFNVKAESPDKTAAIYYFSNLNFLQDYLNPRGHMEIDSYGNLHMNFMDVSEYLQRYAKLDSANLPDAKLISETDWSTNAELLESYRKRCEKRIEDDPYKVLDYCYCSGKINAYSIVRGGRKRIRSYSVKLTGSSVAEWRPVPQVITAQLNNPWTAGAAKASLNRFANAKYDGSLNEWIYTSCYDMNWAVSQRLTLDCREENYEQLKKEVFYPCISNGVYYTPELQKAMDAIQEKRSAELRKKREQERAKEEALRAKQKRDAAAEQQRRQRDKEARDRLYQTQKDIREIRNAAYENKRKSDAKTREIWSDTILGNTRFVDRYGDEHVLHTYDNYAYKSGSTYVTSDSPLDHGYDWEELEKKKY